MKDTPLQIRVGHSPDADDAFMFYALARGKIDTEPYLFRHELVDIETLNRRAFRGELELTALSLHAYAHLTDRYVLCTCGASMGDRYGPMLVARTKTAAGGLSQADDCRARHAHHGLPGLADVLGHGVPPGGRALRSRSWTLLWPACTKASRSTPG